MAEVTVNELAKSVGASVDRLLGQMKEAGLKQTSADDGVSDEEKQRLLTYLKGIHGESSTRDSGKITLKRKKVETLKAGSSTGGKRTVNVEVRKKRTYVKRSEEDIQAQVKAEEESKAPVEVPKESASTVMDNAEEKRLAALEARRKQEEEEAKQVAAAAAAKKAEEEAKVAEAKAKAAEPTAKPEQPKAAAPAAKADSEKRTSKPANKPSSPPKKADQGKAASPSEAPRKKRGTGKAKVQLAHDSKDWSKHSHRPQDFALREDLGEEVEQEKARRRAAETAAIRAKNQHTFKKPTAKQVYEVELPESIAVGELAQRMSLKSGELVKRLMKMGEMVTVNQELDRDTASLVIEEFGHKPVFVSSTELEDKLIESVQEKGAEGEPRASVVTVMGHVDHGKTSLLDYIREAKVASGEAGGITQHIGAYSVETGNGSITFLDTPGHAAFTAMRARGASCTDVVILVVAADDGVMPQTEEAVRHAKAAGVPLVVAVNKIDKEGADPERVKNELSAHEVIPEDWGGDTQFISVSAHTGEGIEALLEAVSLQAELLELKAPVTGAASGVIIESRLEKGRGAVCSVLVQSGTLKRGDIVLAGETFGRVRAMTDEKGKNVTSCGPSTPVEVLGLGGAPNAGDDFLVVPSERKAREVADFRRAQERKERMTRQQKVNLETMFASMGDSTEKKILNVLVKADVRGSAEAIQSALLEIGNDEVGVNITSVGVGGISESDVNLALTTGSIVLGFNVRADGGARRVSEQENVEIRYYSVIYQLLDEVTQALSGMLDPDSKEEIVGIAEVRDVFRSPKLGAIAGCMVKEGAVHRSKPIRVLRDNVVIYEGELESLRRFKDDVNEVKSGTECGIGVKDYNDVQPGDQIEVFDVVEVERTL